MYLKRRHQQLFSKHKSRGKTPSRSQRRRTADSISRMKRWRAAADRETDGQVTAVNEDVGDSEWPPDLSQVRGQPVFFMGTIFQTAARRPQQVHCTRPVTAVTSRVSYHLTRPLFQYVGWFSMPYCNANLLGWSIVFVMWCLVMRTTDFRKLRSCIVDLTPTNRLAEFFNSFYYT